ncbi:MAG: hypothetical protein H6686_10805 [Fibrobacteria bacterium]|nr:hypothetical protein [Fibrobacteria bacterium]
MDDKTVMRRATVFMLLDNASRAFEPLLKMACAVAFVGGAWGAFAYLESLVLVLMRLSLLGLEKGVVWMGGGEPDERAFVRSATGTFGFVFLVGCVVAAAGGVGYALLDGTSSFRQVGHGTWILVSVPFQALATVVLQSLVSRQFLGESILVRNAILPLLTFGLPLGLVVLFPETKEELLPAAYLLASVVGCAFSLGAFAWKFRASLGSWSAIPWPGWRLVRYSLPVSVTEILQSAALRTDHALLFQFGGAREVEIYSVAIMIAKMVQAIRESFDGAALSFFSKPEEEPLAKSKRDGAKYVTWVVLGLQQPLLAGIVLFGASGLALLDPSYTTGFATLVAASVLFSLALPGNLAGTALLGLGKSFLMPITQIVFLVSFVGLNAWLIPDHGALGAGISLGMSNLLSGLVNYLMVHRLTGKWLLEWSSVLKPLAGGLLFAPMGLLPVGGVSTIVAWGAVGTAWFLFVLQRARLHREAMAS